MKRALKIIILVLTVGFIILQFFQIDRTNTTVVQAEMINSVVDVPADIQMILGRACNDCHTNTTRYPWYSYVQPAGWFLKSHIDDGKRELNFSTFALYDANRREKKLEEICDQVTSGEMPLPSYLWIHREAVLTESERTAICDWTKTAAERLQK